MRGYIFPKIEGIETADRSTLVDKLCEEVDECIGEVQTYDNSRNRLAVIAETLDVIHVCESILHNLGVDYAELEDGVNYVTLKNKMRGYYEQDNRSRNAKNSVQRQNH